MTVLKMSLIVAILVVSSIAGAQSSFESFGITPPDVFENRVTIAPDAGIVDVQPIVNVIAPVQQVLSDLCGNLATVGLDKQLQFICTARDIVDLTITGINTLNQDLSSAINLVAGNFISSTANALGGALGLSQVDAGLQSIKKVLTDATGEARAALSQGLGKLENRAVRNLFAYDKRRPLSDPVNLGAMARIMNPEGAEAAISIQKAMTNTLLHSAGSVLTLNQARKRAETMAVNKKRVGVVPDGGHARERTCTNPDASPGCSRLEPRSDSTRGGRHRGSHVRHGDGEQQRQRQHRRAGRAERVHPARAAKPRATPKSKGTA
ncbi:MAG: hypothetical protein HC933_08985 [Pleurocapsa sp. SU_196_0]|nr:hypothetical protein [Pleurocapsa sp. SU_196_0]